MRTQFHAALQCTAMGVCIGDLVENQGGSCSEVHGSLSHSLAEKYQFSSNPVFQWQLSVNRTIAIYYVGKLFVAVKLNSDRGEIINPAYKENRHLNTRNFRLPC